MLYHLLYPLHEQFIGFNVVRYITFRAFMALFSALALFMILGPYWIRLLKRKQFFQTLWEYVPPTHHSGGKSATPTMGGLLLWFSIFVATLSWVRWDTDYIWLILALSLFFALLGFCDDWRKVILKDAHGLKARYKFPIQVVICLVLAAILFYTFDVGTKLSVPFFKAFQPDLKTWYLFFAIFVLVGTANAVNLTDGLDGLVAGPAIIAFLSYAVLAYISGHLKIASYLQVPYVAGAGELAIFCGAVIGALIGFLWFNAHPAEIFMGDVGSLPLGAALGMIALITKNELLLVIIGGIFVLETLSVITQVFSFRLTGRRIFRMAPIHHHFELKGWPESKVIVRFWIISIILALVSLSTLKLR